MTSAPRRGLLEVTPRTVDAGGVELCLETFGHPRAPAVLLIGGATASMDCWEPEFCTRLADGGRFVVRYDHRDTGGSTASPAGKPAYTGEDLSTDPLRILDALRIARAHLVGVSMGGGIAQWLAARHPGRVRTITLIATSPAGERDTADPLPPPEARVRQWFEDPPPAHRWDDRDSVIGTRVEVERMFAGPLGFDEQRARRIAGVVVDRTRDLEASVTNHWLVVGEPDSGPTFRLADLTVPTLVLHGTDDPLFPLEHGRALAGGIPGARLVELPGMGHEVPPPPLWEVVVPEILRHTAH
jgi:pimeloyl-ACP methyl ester carboxylesterase